jgi:hypothetical protein
MAPLPKGPYTIKIDYTVTVTSVPFTHTVEVNVSALGSPAVGTIATAVNLATRSGGSLAFSTAANDFWNLFRMALSTSVVATTATLFRYDGPGIGDVFISAVALTNTTGASGTGVNPGHEMILTLRTGIGGVMKINYLEDIGLLKTRTALTANSVGTPAQRMAAYLLSGSSVVHGRGAAFPVALMNESQTFNEAIEKARFRPNT